MSARGYLLSCAIPLLLTFAPPPASAETDDTEVRGRCDVQIVPPNNTHRDGLADPLIFVNRCVGGCTVTPGTNDSRYDTTTLVTEQRTLSEFMHGDQVWNDMMDCIRDIARPYDVEVTDVDPGEGALYLESMVAGTSAEAGYDDALIMGRSPLAWDCQPLSHTISFAFANAHAPDPQAICETVMHEAGHTLGLDHDLARNSLMYWLTGDWYVPRFFRDDQSECGDGVAEECFCGGLYQNGHMKMTNAYGAGEGANPPEASIEMPDPGENVQNEFIVYALAADKRGMDHVDLLLNGWVWDTAEGKEWNQQHVPYQLRSPANLPDGIIDIEVRAYNDLGVAGGYAIQVIKGAPCTSPDTCLPGMLCEEGKCFWPPPSAALGDECEIPQDCISGDCMEKDGLKLCSAACIPSIADQCEEEEECIAIAGGGGFCWPADGGEGGGGCCSVNEQRSPPWLELGLFLGVILLVSRRARRR
jgi:hypothetical protein